MSYKKTLTELGGNNPDRIYFEELAAFNDGPTDADLFYHGPIGLKRLAYRLANSIPIPDIPFISPPIPGILKSILNTQLRLNGYSQHHNMIMVAQFRGSRR